MAAVPASGDALVGLVDGVHRAIVRGTVAGGPAAVREAVRAADPLLGGSELVDAVDAVMARVAGFGPLQPLLDDPSVSEVMANGPGVVWAERDGVLAPTGIVLDEQALVRIIERMVGPAGRRVDRSSPLVDVRLPDGSRSTWCCRRSRSTVPTSPSAGSSCATCHSSRSCLDVGPSCCEVPSSNGATS